MLKKDLRKKYLAKRHEMSEFDVNRETKLILDLLASNFNFKDKIISLYLPIKSKKEFDTFSVLDLLLNQNSKVGIPKTIFEENDMFHFEFEDFNQLELNKYNIPEPLFGNPISADEFDYVFVPLLTIDKFGNRVGYGKGFYDRFFKKCNKKCKFIGLYLFDEIEVIDDLNEFDLPIHYCITPSKIIKF